eukprot:6462902-Amphidinium_carterae.4
MSGIFSEHVLRQTVKHDERCRFKKEYVRSSKARDVLLDPRSDVSSVVPTGGSSYERVENLFFPYSDRREYKHAEPIHQLEARAINLALLRLTREKGTFGKEVLVLSDSMCCTLAFSKGRCSANPLLGQCRRKAALCLAANALLRVRWCALEHNWADSASRRSLIASDLRREAQIKALRKWHGSKPVDGESRAKSQEEVCASQSGEKQGNEGADSAQRGDVCEPDTKAWATRADIDDQELVLVHGMLEGKCSSMAALSFRNGFSYFRWLKLQCHGLIKPFYC